MFFKIGKEIKDKILAGELTTQVHNRTIQKNKIESIKESKKKKCC